MSKLESLLIISASEALGASVRECAPKGWNVVQAFCGEHGLKVISQLLPVLVVVDAHLPDMNGLAVLDRLNGASSALVLTSQHDSEELKRIALARGAQAYKPYPGEDEDAESWLQELVSLGEGRPELH